MVKIKEEGGGATVPVVEERQVIRSSSARRAMAHNLCKDWSPLDSGGITVRFLPLSSAPNIYMIKYPCPPSPVYITAKRHHSS